MVLRRCLSPSESWLDSEGTVVGPSIACHVPVDKQRFPQI